MAQFRFVMRSGPSVGKTYSLEAPEISIGRDSTNTVALSDAEVSRRHARMELRGSAYVIQDLGSTNGTFVNGTRISGIQVLNPGDTVALGEGIVLVYETVADMDATVMASKSSQTAVAKPATPAPFVPPAPVIPPAPVAPPVFASRPAPAAPAAPAFKPSPPPASSQVPTGPVPMPPSEGAAGKKGGSKTVLIVVIIAVILILCLCVGVPFIADQLKLDCVVPFKWFFNIVGPTFGYGACP